MSSTGPRRVAIIGAALSANKGAAAMVETVVSRLPDTLGECRFDLLTTYPVDDAAHVPVGAPVQVTGLEPLRLALVEFPVACLVLVCRVLHLPTGWVRARGCRSILRSSVVVDVAGISFVDGRGIPITVYNALMTGLPILLGVPVVKAAQALGPFRTRLNRTLARIVLPRTAAICARGERTRDHLADLGLENVVEVADLAFSLDDSGGLPDGARDALAHVDGGYLVVMPSAVVRGIRESNGADYVDEVATLVRRLRRATGLAVVIAPHSYRAGRPEDRMNDGPVCREVVARIADDPLVVGLDMDLSAGQLRALIAGSRLLVTSRFHAMISGLATCTPTIVVGWSHKYREVLADFGMEEMGMDSTVLTDPDRIVSLVADCLADRESIAGRIGAALPAVQAKSSRNFDVIAAAAR